MKELSTLPNIGGTLAARLSNAGIDSPEELVSVGSIAATLRLRGLEERACYNTLYALEGAIRGIRWHAIPKADRDELKRELDSVRAAELRS